MNEKEIRKYLRKQFSPLGWALVIYYVIMNVAVSIVIVLDELLRDPPQELLLGNAWGYLIAATVGFLLMLAWKGGDFLHDRIWDYRKPVTVKRFLGLLAACIGCQLAASIYGVILELLLNGVGLSAMASIESATVSADTFSMFLYAGIIAPVSEEILFRGMIQKSLEPYGKKFAVFGSAFLFGMFHGNLFQSPYAFLVGLVLGYTAMEHSIGWAMLLHMINNLVLGDMLGRITSLLPEAWALLIQYVIIIGCAAAAIVVILKNRRGIARDLGEEPMDRRCLRCFFLNGGVIVMILMMIANMILMITVI